MFIGKENNGKLVLVALIRYEKDWRKRGAPPTWYVAYEVEKNRWVEMPMPTEFEGRKASFLMAANSIGEKKLITKKDRDFHNQIQARGTLGTILLKPQLN